MFEFAPDQFCLRVRTSPQPELPEEYHAFPYGYVQHAWISEGPPLTAEYEGLQPAEGTPPPMLRVIADDGSWHAVPHAYVNHVRVESSELILTAAGWTVAIRGTHLDKLMEDICGRCYSSIARHLSPLPEADEPQISAVTCGYQDIEATAAEGLSVWCGKWNLHVEGANLHPLLEAVSLHSAALVGPDSVPSAQTHTYITRVTVEPVE